MSLDQTDLTASREAPAGAPERSRGRAAAWWSVVVTALVLIPVLAVALATIPVGGPRAAVERVLADPAVVPSQTTMLDEMWTAYTLANLEPGTGRTIDPTPGGPTTSQGQSATMLRAVWSDDQATFDTSWRWTKDNLGRADRLTSSVFGQRADGTYGVLTDSGGATSASGADVDIAFALLMAYSRWQEEGYLYDALPVIDAVWNLQVVEVAGQPVLTADDLQRADPTSVVVAPGSFAPYAFRSFAHVDPTHDWNGLVDSSYALLDRLTTDPLGSPTAVGLPPDLVRLDRATGLPLAPTDPADGSTDFGARAQQLPLRLALDVRWNGDERATTLLTRQASVLGASWQKTGDIAAGYAHDGTPLPGETSPSAYAAAASALELVRPDLAAEVYDAHLLTLYDADTRAPSRPLEAVDANAAWFAAALHLDRLPDLNDPRGSDLP